MLIIDDDVNARNVYVLMDEIHAVGSSGVATDTLVPSPDSVISRPPLARLMDVTLTPDEGRALEQRLAKPPTAPTREPRPASTPTG
jgi:hypothetical protein